jgi:hypothetical protein
MNDISIFQSKPKQTPFAPEWLYFVCHSKLQGVDFQKISRLVLAKEKHILKTTEAANAHAYYTELGTDSLTSRAHMFNVFLWADEEPEIHKLKKAILDSYKALLTQMNIYVPKTWIHCWANVLREGQEIKPPLHAVHSLSYLSGHIPLKCEDTSTVYINPVNQINEPEIHSIPNEVGVLTLFPSCVPHYTTKHIASTERITLAFDLFVRELDKAVVLCEQGL